MKKITAIGVSKMKREYYPEPIWYALAYPQFGYHDVNPDAPWIGSGYIRNYEVPPLHWNRYTREGRELLRKAGITVKEAWLHPETL